MSVTRFSAFPSHAYLALCIYAVLQPAGVAIGQSVRDAVKYEESVVCLNVEGRFLAWDNRSFEFKPAFSAELSKATFTRIASNGNRIWGVQEGKLLEWMPGTKTWEAVARFDAGGEEIAGIAVVGDTPVLIFPTKVVSPLEGRVFEVPRLQGQFNNLRELRVLAVQPTDRVLWIGTGYGEWGGHLVGLNVEKGTWVQFHDALHYVTGITRGPKDELTVSWSMSHFGANTLIRIHKSDATPETSYAELDGKYYQRVAYSPFDKVLFGVETTSIVSISEGKPTTIAELGVGGFENEPKAIGVAPGIRALIPVAPETLFVVPSHSAPLLLRGRKLVPLRGP